MGIAEALLLDSPACGLGLVNAGSGNGTGINKVVSDFVVIFRTGVHQKLRISDAAVSDSFRDGGLGLVTLPTMEEAEPHLSAHVSSKFQSAALVDIDGSLAAGAPFEALAIGVDLTDRGSAGNVLFCRSDTAVSKLGHFVELSSLAGLGQGSNVSDAAIHVCAMGYCVRNEAVMWLLTTENNTSTERSARVFGVGLQSGQRLAEVELQGLPRGSWHSAALSGNSTHLVAVVTAKATDRSLRQSPALVVSAKYATLLAGLVMNSASEL